MPTATVALVMAVEVATVARDMGVDLTIEAGNTLVFVGSLATCARSTCRLAACRAVSAVLVPC
jgi:hypothetical protein